MAGAPKKICVVGGRASGVSLLWCLTSNDVTRTEVDLTLLHDEPTLGGHSHTLEVPFGGTTYPIDVGVQYICPLLYANVYKMLERPEFAGVTVSDGEVRISAAFTPEMNWGNFSDYQSGPRFAQIFTPANQAAAKKFQNDVLLSITNGTFTQKMGDYLPTSDLPDSFVDYMLMPYLSVLNGYGDDEQLLLAEFEDLWPIFTDLGTSHTPGPLGAFLSPGLGWRRFTHGSGSWIDAMATYATGRGATVVTDVRVTAVWPDPDGDGVWVEWTTPLSPATAKERYDEVVLTTDMDTNDALLDNPANPLYPRQHPIIGPDVFQLNPGSCYIHQDPSVLAPWLLDQQEIGQFSGTTPPGSGEKLPYSMPDSYFTWMVQNMVEGLPEPVYVSMYGTDTPASPPAEAKQLAPPIHWKHGRFLGSMMMDAKRGVHAVQGLGHIWFAGNNTTQDSEEGALLSAMVIAGKVCPSWSYPFGGLDAEDLYAFGWYELMKDEFMFPTSPAPSGGRAALFASLAERILGDGAPQPPSS